MAELSSIRKDILNRLSAGETTEKDISEIINDYPQLYEENEKLKEKVRRATEGLLAVKATMEKTAETSQKMLVEVQETSEKFYKESVQTHMKLLVAELNIQLLKTQNEELRRRLGETDPEYAEAVGAEVEPEQVSLEYPADYEPDFEWQNELERNR